MTERAGELKASLEFAVRVAREAGDITLKYFKRSPTPELKADNSFVTVADREVEQHLRDRIGNVFPDDAVLGEEDGESSGTSGRRWIVDPIDGTFSFVHGVPMYGVMIGLEIEDEPVLGVLNVPALDELIFAARGLGCFHNGEPTAVSKVNSLDDALLLTSDLNVCDPDREHSCRALLRNVSAVRTWGDCYGYLLVATGRAEIMLDPVMNIWDCAALLPILEEAGGTFTDWEGRRTIDGGSAIATNGLLFNAVMNMVRESEC